MNFILRVLIAAVDIFFPKKRNRISIPCINDKEWQGNCAFLFQYIKNTHLNDYDIYILCDQDSKLKQDNDTKKHAVSVYSIKGIWYLLTSGVVIYHHGPLAARIPLLPFRRICFHINHGVHFKKVELSLETELSVYKKSTKVKTKWFCKYHAVSSNIDALSCCADYHVYLNDVYITGIPRNDLFFSTDDVLIPGIVQSDFEKIRAVAKDKKIIVYAPTWRDTGGAYMFSEKEQKELELFLLRNNAVFFYAGHPYLNDRVVPEIENMHDYNKLCDDIQSILHCADLLITDYSSVWIDFLLKNKPILGFQFDSHVYKDERGFLFDSNSIFPGRIVNDFHSLLLAAEESLFSENNTHENYMHALKTFHRYADGNNCKRIMTIIKERIDAK